MVKIATEVLTRWPIVKSPEPSPRRVDIGEASVAIAVSSVTDTRLSRRVTTRSINSGNSSHLEKRAVEAASVDWLADWHNRFVAQGAGGDRAEKHS